MPTRRKFRRNKRKTRRRGKKGGKGFLGDKYKVTDSDKDIFKFPSEKYYDNIKIITMNYYKAKYSFGASKFYNGAANALAANLNDPRKKQMEQTLGLCYLAALKELINITNSFPSLDVYWQKTVLSEFKRGLGDEYGRVLNALNDGTWNGINYNFTMPQIAGKGGMQMGPLMTLYGGSLGGPWRKGLKQDIIMEHNNFNDSEVAQELRRKQGKEIKSPFKDVYYKTKMNLVTAIENNLIEMGYFKRTNERDSIYSLIFKSLGVDEVQGADVTARFKILHKNMAGKDAFKDIQDDISKDLKGLLVEKAAPTHGSSNPNKPELHTDTNEKLTDVNALVGTYFFQKYAGCNPDDICIAKIIDDGKAEYSKDFLSDMSKSMLGKFKFKIDSSMYKLTKTQIKKLPLDKEKMKGMGEVVNLIKRATVGGRKQRKSRKTKRGGKRRKSRRRKRRTRRRR